MATNDTPFRDADFEAAFSEGDPAPVGMDLEAAEEREEGAADNPAEEAAEGGAEEAGEAAAGAPVPVAAVVVVEDEGAEKKVTPSAEAAEEKTEGEGEAAAQAAGKAAAPTDDQRAAQLAKAVTPPAGEGDPLDLSDVPAEDLQKAKSWAGRLKKMEEDLKAREAALKQPAAGGNQAQAAAAIDQAAQQAAASGDTQQAQAVADVAQQVKDGDITPEQAMKMLAEDFGDDFVRMVSAVAKSAVGKPAPAQNNEELTQTKAELQALKDQATRDHFEMISEAHPDFVQIYEDQAFRQWATANGKDQVVQAGSARQINKMLDQYKQAAKPAAANPGTPAQDAVAAARKAAPPAKVDQAALDAAEGVRSGGVRVPDKPARAEDDFAKAFDEY